MAQFDVYRNPSQQTRHVYPFILDVQHSVIDALSTRIVVPLCHAKSMASLELKGLTPVVMFEGDELLVLVSQIASMPAKLLKNPVGTIAHLREEIVSAFDLAITGV